MPDEPARRAARTIRPSDLALLALRVAILMSAGLALARPQFRAPPSGAAHVIAIELTVDSAALRNAVRSLPPADRAVYVVFDTTPRMLSDETGVFSGVAESPSTVSLSAGLLGAIRQAHVLAREYEQVDITLVSTFDRHAFDEATARIRAMWPDSIRVLRLPINQAVASAAQLQIDADVDDPVVAGLRLAQANGLLDAPVRVFRARTGADALTASGAVTVFWPRNSADDSTRIGGVHTRSATVVGHFIRTPIRDSGTAVAHWTDGRPAAIERIVGEGCVRTIGFDVPNVGDFTLTPAFQRLAAELLSPCVENRRKIVASDSLIATIAGPPATALEMPDDDRASSRLAAALMMLAVLLSMMEWISRRSPARRRLESTA